MATPKWQPGKLYPPGSLVVPRTAPVAGTILPIENPSFETGDLTGWTVLAGNFVVTDQEQGAYEGQYELTTRHEPEDIIVSDTRAPIRPGDACTARIYLKPTRSSDRGTVRIYWYDENGDPLATREFDENPHKTPGHIQGTGGWRQSTLTKNAPAGAAFFAVGVYVRKHTGSYFGVDLASWHYPVHQPQQGLMYKAVQPATGYSDTTEPAWPGVLGQQVTDNEVIWEAVSISRVVWEARPTMLSGADEPDWPTTAGARVSDGTISWEAVSRRVEDPNCPNSRVTAIVASKVFKADRDIVRFSATANPLDWTTERDAGYLPTGLQQANANDMAVLNQYRGNLVAFNASSFQMWQVDPDPQAMAILDQMDGIGSSWQGAAQPVGNELFYLSQQGVRTVGIANAAHNLAAGDVGQPIDELVQEHVEAGIKALSTYYPGAGQYWLAFTEDTPAGELRISGDLPDGRVGDPIDYTYLTTGGLRPYRFRIVSGSLPPGTTMDPATSRVTGEFTVPGFYSWRVQVEDRLGNSAWVDDNCTVDTGEFLPPQLSDWRYLQISEDDDSDYSAPEYDDSHWPTGAAPFGGWEEGYGPVEISRGAPDGFNYPPQYDSRFEEKFGTAWDVHTRLWIRRTLTLPEGPIANVRVIAYIEDHCNFFVNGYLFLSTPEDHDGGIGQTFVVGSDSFVQGENVIAIQCGDEPDVPGISVTYADFILEWTTDPPDV